MPFRTLKSHPEQTASSSRRLSRLLALLFRVRYLFAVAVVALAVIVRWPFAAVLGQSAPYLTFFPAVIVSAWVGGLGPGLLSTALSGVIAQLLYIEPHWELHLNHPSDFVSLTLYFSVGAFLSWITSQLQQSRSEERRLRVVAEQTLSCIGDAVVVTDARGSVTFLNAIAEKLTGWALTDALEKPLDDIFRIVNEETKDPVESPVTKALREGVAQGLANHTELISRTGHRTPIDDSAAPIFSEDGLIIGAILVFRDVAQRRNRERTLAESRRQLHTTLESISDALVTMDADWVHTYVNPAAERLLGKSARDLIGKNHWEEYPDARGTIIETSYRAAVQDSKPARFENYYAPLDKWFEVNAYPSSAGGVSVYFRDITDRKKAEAAARENEEHLRLLSEANVIGIVFCDVHGNVRDANDEYLRIVGYTRADLAAGRVRWTEVTSPEWFQLDRAKLAEAHETGHCEPYEKEYTRPDGTRIPVYVGFVLFGAERRSAVAFVVDISAQKKAEAALRESESNLRLALKASRMGVWTNDLSTRRVTWSRELEDIFGIAPGTYEGTEEAFFSYIHPEDRERVGRTVADAIDGHTDYQVEFRFLLPNGQIGWMEGRGQALYGDSGEPVRLAGIGLDITGRKVIEKELVESAGRLRRINEELQQFTYAVSHDLTEPLRTVGSYVQLLERRYKSTLDDSGRDFIRFAVDGVKRMQQLIDALLEYSRAGEVRRSNKGSVNLEHALETSLAALQAAIDGAAAVVTHDPLPEVSIEPVQVTQLLQNLISNAVKYAQPGLAPRIHVKAYVADSSWVIELSDNGQGIAPEHHDRIFGVFQRLHGRDVPGTGIGLATCKKIVEGWGGRIWVRSELGHGATFFFTVPATLEQIRRMSTGS